MIPPGAPPVESPKRILIVDDELEHVQFLERHLHGMGHHIETAQDGFEAMARVKLGVDLVLLDVRMPRMDGFEVARQIRADPAFLDLPIIMVTVLGNKDDRLRAVEAGANDFISKPVDLVELHVRTRSLLKLKEARDQLRRRHDELEIAVTDRTRSLRSALDEVATAQRDTYEAHLETIRRLAVVAEYKDPDTAQHIQRVREYAFLLAQGMGLPPGEVEMIQHAAPMHDVGKIIVPETILLKPEKLTHEEWKVMQQHTVAGGSILGGSSSKLLQMGEIIALSHHEKWDGSGYPKGISERDIPAAGRIIAVADVFDALTSERPYKKAYSFQETLDIMQAEADVHFDPAVLGIFVRHRHTVKGMLNQYRSTSGS
ncbi:MAG: response regulator [Candidatus Tectomicrobia bacterium]|uniref:Response regulator n=1 Tax=Tectimicrobiota bacterium TaxID=2528274 RepID=A0A932MP88_UNCTE|nr:response regulator [Candidatus Tectomicrobia bacterium]